MSYAREPRVKKCATLWVGNIFETGFNDTSRIASCNAICWHVFRNNRVGSNDCIITYSDTFTDSCVFANPHIFSNMNRFVC